MFKNYSKYEAVNITDDDDNTTSTKYDVYYKGWSYDKWIPTQGWRKVATVDTEDEAKQKCADLLPGEDD